MDVPRGISPRLVCGSVLGLLLDGPEACLRRITRNKRLDCMWSNYVLLSLESTMLLAELDFSVIQAAFACVKQ